MDPRQFYQSAYAAVLDAARRQGAPHPETLAHLGATQASHETAWGKHAPANNYFGIKGGSGPAIRTHEVMGGRNLSVMDHFRGYSGLQGSADDYVKLMSHSPRYRGVFNAASIPEAINAQARSGYATDPQYGQKLASIHARGSGGGAMPAPAPVQTAHATVDQTRSPVFKQPIGGGPAPVQVAAATPDQRANPRLDASLQQKPASTLLEKFNPVSSANAAPMPQSATLPRINPADPSGPLRPASAAPVQTPAATPAQLAQPQLNPLGAGSSYQDAAARMRGTGFNGYGPGITEQNDIRTAFGDNARKGDMPGDVPYAVTMAGSQQYMQNVPPPAPVQQLPPIDVGRVPQGPGNGYQPATPGYAPMTSDPTQYQPIQTPLSTPAVDPASMPAPAPVDLPSTDPGPTFTPTDTSPAMGDSMPSVGGEGGGGGMGDMLSGLADALGNLGGGGEGGGGQQMPNPTSGGADALQATASMPDFPHLGDQYGALLQQRGALADAPVGMPQAPGFNLKQIGQAGQQPDQSMEGFARPALKRLFTA